MELKFIQIYLRFLDGKTVTIAGWGALGFSLPSPEILMKVELGIITNSDCSSRLVDNIVPSKVCTYARKKGK